jgi:hypothetical protein
VSVKEAEDDDDDEEENVDEPVLEPESEEDELLRLLLLELPTILTAFSNVFEVLTPLLYVYLSVAALASVPFPPFLLEVFVIELAGEKNLLFYKDTTVHLLLHPLP